MLKKKSGAGFKPKAPVRRNVPAATTPSQSLEKPTTSATERQSATPASAPSPTPSTAPTPAPAPSTSTADPTAPATPPPSSRQPTPSPPSPPSQPQPAAAQASHPLPVPSTPQHETPIQLPQASSTANIDAVTPQVAPRDGGITEPRSNGPQLSAPDSTPAEAPIASDLPTPSSEITPAPPQSISQPDSEVSTTQVALLQAASEADSNIDPILRHIPSTPSTQTLSTAPTNLVSEDAPAPNAQSVEPILNTTTSQLGPLIIDTVVPPADAASNELQQSIEPVAEPSTNEPSSGPTPRQPRKRKQAAASAADGEDSGVPKKRARRKKPAPSTEDQESAPARRRAPRRRITTGAEAGTEGGAEEEGEGEDETTQRPGKTGRHRSVTPEDAEKMEVDIRQVKMGDLVKDLRIGKKFSRHDELLERERIKRQKHHMAKRFKGTDLESLANGSEGSRAGSTSGTPGPSAGPGEGAATSPALKSAASGSPSIAPPGAGATAAASAPQFQVIDGQIVLNSGSLQFDRHAHAAEEAGDLEEEVEDEFTHHTTSSSFMKRPVKPNTWTAVETEKFYHALAMLGTSFDMITKMFPGKNRRHIKLKFNREERLHPTRIHAVLVGDKKVALDLDEYKTHTGEEYQTVDAITAEHRKAEEEFEAEQRRAEEEEADEARRKREELFGAAGKKGAGAEGQVDGDGGDGGEANSAPGRYGRRRGRKRTAAASAGLGG